MSYLGRFSSCRGVEFEINPNKPNHFAILRPVPDMGKPPSWSRRSSSKVVPFSRSLKRMVSQTSSHFCDLDMDLDDDIENYLSGELQVVIENPVEAITVEANKKPLPTRKPQPRSRLSVMLLDQGLFTVYKRLFVVCLFINVVGLALAASGNFPYGKKKAAMFSIGNIFALVMCRSEAFLRVVFWLVVKLLGRPFVPVRVKTATTSFLQSLGGVHSGCGVSSVAWLTYALFLTFQDRDNSSTEIISVACAILFLITLSALAAFPLLRHLHHNVFERTHRFAGWTSLALVWVFVILTECYQPSVGVVHLNGGIVTPYNSPGT